MFSNVPNRYGVKSTRPSLKLKKRAESLERQSTARDEAVADVRNTSEQPPEEEFWIDDHFQQMLKSLVREVVEAENELYSVKERAKRLQDSKSEGKVPSGLTIHRVTAKGKNSQPLQERFDAILKEAELKLLDATIAALAQDEQLCTDRCTTEKKNVEAAIQAWRNSFQASEANLDIDADHFIASAKCFANDFYFQCVAIRTSKKVAVEQKKAAKEADRARKMETEFQVNEESIKEIVAREIQNEFSKRHSVLPVSKQSSTKPTNTNSRGQRKNSRSSSRNRNPSKTGRGPKTSTPQQRQSRSRTRKQQGPRKQSVTFSGNRSQSARRRQPPKNGKRPANGSVK